MKIEATEIARPSIQSIKLIALIIPTKTKIVKD